MKYIRIKSHGAIDDVTTSDNLEELTKTDPNFNTEEDEITVYEIIDNKGTHVWSHPDPELSMKEFLEEEEYNSELDGTHIFHLTGNANEIQKVLMNNSAIENWEYSDTIL